MSLSLKKTVKRELTLPTQHTAHDSEIDLSEESASDSNAECDAELEPKLGPLGPDIYSNSAVK